MELEREPRKRTPIGTSNASRILPQTSFQTDAPLRKNYSREVCAVTAILLFTIGLIGFVVDDLFGAHLSYTNNLLHVFSGMGAAVCGYYSLTAAKRFSLVMGSLYILLGILGFAFGTVGKPNLGNMTTDPHLWQLSPEVIEFGTVDHGLHFLFGAAFLVAALLTFRRRDLRTTSSL